MRSSPRSRAAMAGEPIAVAWGERTRPFFGVVAGAAARCIPQNGHSEIVGATYMCPEERPA